VNAQDGQPSPTTGQFAERQGRQCARNIVCVLQDQPTRPFRFKMLGELCSIGGHSAVADLCGMHLSGFLAWFMWRSVYLFKLPTLGRRLQVGFDWAMLLVFPRDLTHVLTEQTQPVAHAHYDPGEFIFRRGEEPNFFYVLESGEVELLRATDGSEPEVVAVLAAGSFFGERALLSNHPHVLSSRARTPVEVLILGRHVFTRMSDTLAPLRDALARTLNRRALDFWKNRPQIHEVLRTTPVKHLMEPLPQPLLKPEASIREVGHAFVEHRNEFFYVSSDGETLEGVITITDLLRGREKDEPAELQAKHFMTQNPVAVALDDDCAVAANAIREYRLKSLPVVDRKDSRRLVGCLRIRRLAAFVLKETEPARVPDAPLQQRAA